MLVQDGVAKNQCDSTSTAVRDTSYQYIVPVNTSSGTAGTMTRQLHEHSGCRFWLSYSSSSPAHQIAAFIRLVHDRRRCIVSCVTACPYREPLVFISLKTTTKMGHTGALQDVLVAARTTLPQYSYVVSGRLYIAQQPQQYKLVPSTSQTLSACIRPNRPHTLHTRYTRYTMVGVLELVQHSREKEKDDIMPNQILIFACLIAVKNNTPIFEGAEHRGCNGQQASYSRDIRRTTALVRGCDVSRRSHRFSLVLYCAVLLFSTVPRIKASRDFHFFPQEILSDHSILAYQSKAGIVPA